VVIHNRGHLYLVLFLYRNGIIQVVDDLSIKSSFVITTVISLIIALAILGIVYIVAKWIIGMTTLPAPLIQIVNIVFGCIAVILVLRFLITLL
jgi:hypothetical protein